jgi:hypothetical protein
VDKGSMYIRVTLYCGHLIILWLFHLGVSCTVCFNLYCGGFILFCNVCVCVCMCGFCKVCVCVSFVMCGCSDITVHWVRFLLTWLRFFLRWQIFPCFLLSCKANARVKLAKNGARPALFHIISYLCCSVVICVVLILFVCKCVLPPGDNPTAVNKYIK